MSEVKVNKISPRTNCGTVQLGDSGDTVTVTGDLRSDSLKAADGGVIISQSGTTITLGASGDTVSLASGASQTGFGRTGTVNWQTTPKTSATFTAVNGEGYFVDTSSNAINMSMPAGSAGAIVSIQDYNKTFDSNALTITPNGTEKINGGTAGGPLIIGTEGQGLTFVCVDGTVGWKTVYENDFTGGGSLNLVATGGTETIVCTNYKVHTFTGPGTFTVSQVSATAADNVVSYMVVAGGGGGSGGPSGDGGGGGGAGGFREFRGTNSGCYSVSPLNGATPITVTAQAYSITVGGGGTGTNTYRVVGGNGNVSTFACTTSTGGGGGGGNTTSAATGGSGGGGGAGGGGPFGGANGNTPSTSPAQGTNGGEGGALGPGTDQRAGGGGGATAVGQSSQPTVQGGDGGAGATTSITGSPVVYAGGGGGMSSPVCGTAYGAGGSGGGGTGSSSDDSATSGTDNLGGGGGGAGGPVSPSSGGNGGSGIVVIRYKFQ